jgi:hypothetical protein
MEKMKKSLLYIFISLSFINQIFLIDSLCAQEKAFSDKSVGEMVDSSYGVIVLAGISTILSTTLYNAADKQEQDSKANVVKMEKMIASFKDSYAAFCPKGREDMTDAKCYCYAADGSKNSGRTNSQTCIDLWNKNSYRIDGTATNYGASAFNPDVAGCVMVNGAFDEACKCKKLVDAKGVNACKKESAVSMPNDAFSTGLATAGGATDLLKFAANASSGNPRFDLLNTASLGSKAIKSKQISDAMATKLDKNIKLPNINNSNVDKFANAILGSKNIADQMASSKSMPMNVASSRSDNPAMNSLIHQAQIKAGIDVTGGKGLNAVKTAKKNGIDLNFGSDSAGNSGGQVIGNFPEAEKNYKYKNSDIVTDNTASLFEIISNRYIQSGLKRLFDDEGK